MKRATRGLLAVAVGELAVARLRLALCSDRRLIAWLQQQQAAPAPPRAVDLDALASALAAAARRVPWRADCLVAALAATRWLRRLRLAPQAFVGVAKTPDGALLAHAWVRCGGRAVAGDAATDFVALIRPDAAQASGSERLR